MPGKRGSVGWLVAWTTTRLGLAVSRSRGSSTVRIATIERLHGADAVSIVVNGFCSGFVGLDEHWLCFVRTRDHRVQPFYPKERYRKTRQRTGAIDGPSSDTVSVACLPTLRTTSSVTPLAVEYAPLIYTAARSIGSHSHRAHLNKGHRASEAMYGLVIAPAGERVIRATLLLECLGSHLQVIGISTYRSGPSLLDSSECSGIIRDLAAPSDQTANPIAYPATAGIRVVRLRAARRHDSSSRMSAYSCRSVGPVVEHLVWTRQT